MVTINGIEWKIIICSSSNSKLRRSDNVYTLGVTDLNDKSIYLAVQLKGQLLYKVLCHELVHAACFSYGYFLDIKTEEIVADFISLYGSKVIMAADTVFNNLVGGAGWKQSRNWI